MTTIRPEGLATPHASRFKPSDTGYSDAMAAHAAAVDAGHQGYIDPTSRLFVMAATYLASRACCDRGCRHCPYVLG